MPEPSQSDAMTQASQPRSSLLIAGWLVAAVAGGAGLGLAVSSLGNPAGLVGPSESPRMLESATPSAERPPAASATTAATGAPSEAPSPVLTPAATGAGDFADLQLEFGDVEPMASIGRIWDDDLAHSVARQIGVDVTALGLRSVATLTSDPLPPDWRVITVSYPGGDAISAVGGYLAEQLRRPQMRVGSGPINESERVFVFGDDFALTWSAEQLVLMGFDVDPYLEASSDERNALPNPYLLIATVAERVLGPSADEATRPSWRPFPSISPEPTAPPDPELEALLPTSVLGHPQQITSFASMTWEQVSSFMGGLHPWLLTDLERQPRDASLAIGAGSVSNFTMWAHRIRGVFGDELLGSYLGMQYVRLMSAQGQVLENREVGGRRYIASESHGLYAQGDVLYWILYFDFGDCFDECDYDTRPPFEEILRDAVMAIPGG